MIITFTPLIFYTLCGLIIVLTFWLLYLEWRLKKILRGKQAVDLEGVLIDMGREIDELANKHQTLTGFTDNINSRLKKSIQKVHTLRFNPFRDQGGNQSFSTCLLDEDGNGVVISSLYSRDKVNVYAKPILGGKSDFELSEEELESITRARASQKD